MKANELRLGNKLTNFLGEVFDCNAETIRSFESNYFPYGKPLPIPLTEEWLLKFGFKYKGNGLYTYGFNEMFKVDCHEFGIDFYYGNTYEYFVKPHFVHALQNLCFALTRKELTIKTK